MKHREKPYDVETSIKAVKKKAEGEGYLDWGWPPLNISTSILIMDLLERIEKLESCQKKLKKKLKKNKCNCNEPIPPEF